jgi:hypothetical protein
MRCQWRHRARTECLSSSRGSIRRGRRRVENSLGSIRNTRGRHMPRTGRIAYSLGDLREHLGDGVKRLRRAADRVRDDADCLGDDTERPTLPVNGSGTSGNCPGRLSNAPERRSTQQPSHHGGMEERRTRGTRRSTQSRRARRAERSTRRREAAMSGREIGIVNQHLSLNRFTIPISRPDIRACFAGRPRRLAPPVLYSSVVNCFSPRTLRLRVDRCRTF